MIELLRATTVMFPPVQGSCCGDCVAAYCCPACVQCQLGVEIQEQARKQPGPAMQQPVVIVQQQPVMQQPK